MHRSKTKWQILQLAAHIAVTIAQQSLSNLQMVKQLEWHE
jgi:hypothetical protein